MTCFHVGCTSGYSSHSQNNGKRKPYETCHLFRCPGTASDEVKKEWIRNIPKRKGVEFNIKSNRLCSLHFEEKFIFKHLLGPSKNGNVILGERKRWKLKEDAVPTIFANAQVSPIYNKSSQRVPSARVRAKSSTTNTNQKPWLASQADAIILPNGWHITKSLDPKSPSVFIFKFGQIVNDSFLDMQKTISVKSDNHAVDVEIKFHGTTINEHIQELKSVDDLNKLLVAVEGMNCCPGVMKFENLLFKSHSAKLRNNVWYSTSCSGSVSNGKRCGKCVKLASVLQTVRFRECQKLSVRHRLQTTPSLPNKAKSFVKQKKKAAQTKNLKAKLFRSKRRSNLLSVSIKALNCKLQSKPEEDMLDAIEKCKYELEPNFKHALKAALSNAKRKSKHGHRYDSKWLLQSLLLKIKSPKAYRHLRESNMLPLPHESTLHRLLQGVPCEFGFNDQIFYQFQDEYRKKSSKEREGVIMFDEIKVREELCYDKIKYQFHGFVDYGGTTQKSKNEGTEMADHALVFMFRSQFDKTVQPVGSFATRGAAPGDILAELLLSCILRLEAVGVRASAMVTDGATPNKNMWKGFGIKGESNTVINKILHPCSANSDARYFYFFSDVPHIIKCIRNNFFKHQSATYCGEFINSGYYRAVYDLDKQLAPGLRVIPKITSSHVNPSNFEKMRVSLATQIFSNAMASALQFYRERKEKALIGSEPTQTFTQDINNLFDSLNARYSAVGVTKSSEQYKIIEDFREKLTFDDIYNSFASKVTLESLRVTLQSFIDIISYWTSLGFNYVLTGKVSQDALEKFFGIIRNMGGDDDHPTVTSFLHLYRILCMYTPSAKIVRGNVATDDHPTVMSNYVDTLLGRTKVEVEQNVRIRRDMDDKIISKIVTDSRAISTQHLTEHNYFTPEANDCVVYQLCGYVAHRANKLGTFTKCHVCVRTLFSYEPSQDQSASLTWAKTMGYLKYPSTSLYNLIRNSVEPTIRAYLSEPIHGTVVTKIIESLNSLCCSGIGCNEEDHTSKLVIRIVTFYITIRMYFFSKHYNREVIKSRIVSKKQRKLAKLT